jgi:hypothetical protein
MNRYDRYAQLGLVLAAVIVAMSFATEWGRLIGLGGVAVVAFVAGRTWGARG